MAGDRQERGGKNHVPRGGRRSNVRMDRGSSRSSRPNDASCRSKKRWVPKSSPRDSEISETSTVKGHSSGEAQTSGTMDGIPSSVKGFTLNGTRDQDPEASDLLHENSEGELNPSPSSNPHQPQSSNLETRCPGGKSLQSSSFTSPHTSGIITQRWEKDGSEKVILDQKYSHECPTPTRESQNVDLAPETVDKCLGKGSLPTVGPSLQEKNGEKLTTKGSQNGELPPEVFDICPGKGSCQILRPPLSCVNRERRRVQEAKFLRPGMVLLENYLSLSDQVDIVKKCRDLGVGEAGFYRPGYREGGKLNLRMMCMGKNWVPGDGSYGDRRPEDGARPPPIPTEFTHMVRKALEASNALITNRERGEELIPRMTPNICIVNFYTTSGRLGLHQDKDESPDSLKKGLPVVSFSIGHTAVFLYGDKRDAEEADSVKLNSGDVLIFGGKSRHVFHGVSKVEATSGLPTFLRDARLRPGRLNLTFRQY